MRNKTLNLKTCTQVCVHVRAHTETHTKETKTSYAFQIRTVTFPLIDDVLFWG